MAPTVNFENQSGISIFRSIEEMSGAFFDFITDEFTLAIANKQLYHLALSGGNTPVKIFNHLSRLPLAKLNWNFLHIYWGDERCVPPEDPESNFGNIWNTILKKINIPVENIHRIHGENVPDLESKRYTDVLKKYLPYINRYPQFDLTLLGMGDDGHTASIFPGSIEFINSNKICYNTYHPQSRQKRITLSLKVLNNSKKVLFIVTGESKAEILSQIINRKAGYQKLPSSYINPQSGCLKWFIDINASSKLTL
jgi:6-phosphogluconolactonase